MCEYTVSGDCCEQPRCATECAYHRHEVTVSLTAKEIQTLVAAMAGNHPASLAEYRMPVLRKLAKARSDAR